MRGGGIYVKIIIWHVALFAVAMLINTVITQLFFSGSGYLNDQVLWGNVPIKQIVSNIIIHGVQALFGIGIFYTPFFCILSTLTILFLVLDAVKKNGKGALRWLYVAAGVGLQFCPFFLTVYMGTAPTYRSQLAYPFVIACDALILLGLSSKKRLMGYVSILLIVAVFWNQANVTTRLIYTDEIRTQEDMRIASAVEQKISEVAPNQDKIAIVGVYSNHLNGACIRGDLIGMSMLNHGSEFEPHYAHSSERACVLLQTAGFSFKSIAFEQMIEARQKALCMPAWPAPGSVVNAGEYVIVKLSEDRWPEEVLSTKIQRREKPSIDNILQYSMDSYQVTNNQLIIRGWLFQEGVSSEQVMPEVILKLKTTGEYVQISAARTSINRTDLLENFENGYLYTNSGYVAIADISELKAPLSEYTLILGSRNVQTGETHYSETEYVLREE